MRLVRDEKLSADKEFTSEQLTVVCEVEHIDTW